ncbi:patched family-domain-containing protein [Dichotomocladium elegans]|nr:patched family-domain-containing protein [Dichotomocladium elegans]
MRGQCGLDGWTPLNCIYNEPAVEPETEAFRQLLVETCGAQYETGPVCCDEDQVSALANQVKLAEPIVASCPACWSNFMTFWCSFTCSPNQSTFVNVTDVTRSKDNVALVNRTDFWVGTNFGSDFYDSCKDIKFGSSNGYAMDFIGGGAKGWLGMVSFMGKKQPIGSPFQIDFPPPELGDALQRFDARGKACNDSDPAYRCACVDCEAVCPVLPPSPDERPQCFVGGSLTCWAFAMVSLYSLVLLISIILTLFRSRLVGRLVERWFALNLDQRDSRGSYEPVALTDDDMNNDENAHLLDPDHTPRRYWLNARLQNWFYKQGLICARHPWAIIVAGLLFVILCSTGWSHFEVERDPINLWVSPSSRALAEKNHFDSHFTPFYRATQLFFVSQSGEPIASADHLESLFSLEDEIRTMTSEDHGYTLDDVCFHPNGDACVVQSVTGYWYNTGFDPDTWRDDLAACIDEPSICLPDFQQPLKPQMVLGGYEDDHYINATAFVVTFVLQNSLDPTVSSKAEEWEKTLLRKILLTVNSRPEWEGVRITFSTESSLETELNKSSNTDAKTVIISYIVMFVYASVALGKFRSWNPKRFAVDTKFGLGICGILIVIFSVSTAVGLFSFTGKKTTLIIAEVIPFLVLAVGVDNIFILCHEYERREESEEDGTIEERLAKTLGKMGPSILLSSLSETIAFGLGTLVTMPAVSSFAFVASVAILIDFILQVTCFVSCMALDASRAKADRLDCMPCIRVSAPAVPEKEGFLERICRVYYVPAILARKSRYLICLFFLGLFMFALAIIPELSLGLDQRIALPSDSYLVPYFNDLDVYFNMGPPVYFVVEGANMTERETQKKICGRFSACEELSLANVLEQERKRPQVSYIGEPTSVWLDEYLHWLNPNVGCCFIKQDTASVKSNIRPSPLERAFLKSRYHLCDPDFDDHCNECMPDWSTSMENLPEGTEFLNFYDLWIHMPPDENCPLGGKAAFGDAIVVDREHVSTKTSHFRTFHTPLRTQHDFIAAHASARRIANDMSTNLGVHVYPYSVFYVFFEQYSYISLMAFELLGVAILTIFIVTSTLLGSIRSGVIVMGVVVLILVDVVGVMTLWGVSLNAVSLVNLIICVGISVEFCCHIARGFMVASGSREERAARSMTEVGSSVKSPLGVGASQKRRMPVC